MIKRWILHIEFHWGYRPRISIKRVPRPGDWVFDGGEWGQLIACRECGGDGLLHLVKPKQYMQAKPESLFPEVLPPEPHTWDGIVCLDCDADVTFCPYPPTRPRSDHESNRAMDLNVSVALSDAPETTVLELGPHSLDYKTGEVISYWRTDYVVEKIEYKGDRREMYLRRIDTSPNPEAEFGDRL